MTVSRVVVSHTVNVSVTSHIKLTHPRYHGANVEASTCLQRAGSVHEEVWKVKLPLKRPVEPLVSTIVQTVEKEACILQAYLCAFRSLVQR